MNEVIKNMMERRSIRRFKQDRISKEDLNLILRAGLYAPSAGGGQAAIVVASLNQEANLGLGRINQAILRKIFGNIDSSVKANLSVSKDQPSIIDDDTIENAFYDAPVVLTIFAPKDHRYATEDCCAVAENIMLAAHSLGVGTCMIVRAEDTFASEYGMKLQAEWGVDEGYIAKVNVAMGYPASAPAAAKPRKENRIMIVE